MNAPRSNRQLLTHQRNANEDEHEDERDDEMSESTHITRTEKRKDFQTDETQEELWALLPVTDSSHASSLRPSHETQEQLERSSKQARTVGKGVERLHDISYLFQKGHHQKNEFLRARMAGMRKLKKKDDGRTLHFPSCTPDVQAAVTESIKLLRRELAEICVHRAASLQTS